MKHSKWTPEEEAIIIKGKEKRLNNEHISQALKEAGYNRTQESVRKYYSRNMKRTHNVCQPEIEVNYEEELERLDAMRNRVISSWAKKYIIQRPPIAADYKILALCDTHGLMFNDECLKDALEEHGDADELVIVGDFFDNHAMSAWTRHQEIPFPAEYHVMMELLKMLSENFPRVRIVMGNHEYRAMNYFARRVSPGVMGLCNYDILQVAANGYDFEHLPGDPAPTLVKKYDFENVYYDGGQLGWYTIVGKALFVHPLRGFSKVRFKTIIQAFEYFRDREPDIDCIVMGHTHKQGKTTAEGISETLLLETGCCCMPLPYESEGRMTFTPQQLGYSVVYMDEDGNVDFHKSNAIYWGTGAPIKDVRHMPEKENYGVDTEK